MITNAKLLRIDVPGVPTGAGDVPYTTGAAIAGGGVDCCIDQPTRAQRWTLGAVIEDVTAVMYVIKEDLPAGAVIDKAYRVSAALEGDAAVYYEVVHRIYRVKDELTHFELFLKVRS